MNLLRILLKEAYESGKTLELEKDKRRQQTSRYQDLEKVGLPKL